MWEYCEVDFDGSVTKVFKYDEAGEYIDSPKYYARLGIALATLGHDGWEVFSQWWRNRDEVTYSLKRPITTEWTENDRKIANEEYKKNYPRDRRF